MTRGLLPVVLIALIGHAGAVAAQSAGGANTLTAGPPRPSAATDCASTRRAAAREAASLQARLRDGDTAARRAILLDLLMSADAAALFPCLPRRSTGE